MSIRGEAYSLLTWRDEHEEIARSVLAAERAVDSGSVQSATSAIDELADALETHFSVEERAYLPMVEALSPRGAEFSAGIRLAHGRLRESLEQLHELIDLARWREARRSFALLVDRFRAHEEEELSFAEEVMQLDPDIDRRTFATLSAE